MDYQIGKIEASGYHKAAGYKTAGEAVQAALKGVRPHSSKFYELRVWADKILGACEERGIEVPPEVFKNGNVAKFYQAANYLSPIIRTNSIETGTEIKKVLADIVNPAINSTQFRVLYTHNPQSRPLAFKANGYLVINSAMTGTIKYSPTDSPVVWNGLPIPSRSKPPSKN